VDAKLLRWFGEDWPAPVVQRVVPIASPAAGADFTITTPGESTWSVLSIAATLTTSAVVANRVPVLRMTDGSSVLWRVPALVAVTASLTTQVSWVAELGYQQAALSGGALTVGLPPMYLQPGNIVALTTSALDVGDTWTNIVVQVAEVFNGHVERERGIADSIRDEAEAIAGVIEGTL
jgi:hypothetical protein